MNHSFMQDINGLLYSHFESYIKLNWKAYLDGDFSEILMGRVCVCLFFIFIHKIYIWVASIYTINPPDGDRGFLTIHFTNTAFFSPLRKHHHPQ